MRIKTALALGALLVLLLALPTSNAAFNDATSNVDSAVAASVNFTPSYRVTTYEATIGSGSTTATLTLDQNLSADYFVLLRGAAGDYSASNDRGPDDDYARIDQDPFGNLAAGSTSANQLRLARVGTTGDWNGQVTVMECIADCDLSGFRLTRVNEVTMSSGSTSASINSGGSWGGGIGQMGIYGGSYGGGMETTASSPADHKTGWARIWPQGGNKVNLSRSNTGPGSLSGSTTFSIYVVQWGDEWTIQRATVTGSNGGDGVNATGEYDTGSISSVTRANTWVWAVGEVDHNTISAGWEGHTWTLGDGVNQNATETSVAVGAETGAQREVEVYTHTHSQLSNQYVFGTDGTAPGIVSGSTSGTATISGPSGTESYGSGVSAGSRFVIVANTSNGATTNYPRPMVWGQLDANTSARWQRSRSGEPGAYWMQVPDFAGVGAS